MATHFTVEFDPAGVLGVAPDASLEEIREAYRAKVKRYHPDTGGEDWAFRIVSRSYEILSAARVVRATRREYDRATPAPPPPPRPEPSWSGRGASAGAGSPPPPPPPGPGREPDREGFETGEWVREGAADPSADPTRVVDVERMTIVYEADQTWLLSDRSAESHYLSCSLNVSWPDPDLTSPPGSIPGAEAVLKELGDVIDALCVQSRAMTSRTSVVDGRFAGWVSYPNAGRAAAAFARLRQLLQDRGYAVKQRSRDVMIPRQWK